MTLAGALVLAASIAAAPSGGTTAWRPAEVPPLYLSWTDLSGMPNSGVSVAIEHVETLLRPAGVRLIASGVAPGAVVEAGSLVVVLAREPLGATHPDAVLWGAVVPDGGPALWAYPRAIASGLGLDPDATHTWRGPAALEFARFLGVVVAHELLHRLAAAPHHPAGLMAESLSPLDAVFAQELSPALFPALRAGAARLSAGASLPTPRREIAEPSGTATPRRECRSWHSSSW